MSRITLDSEPTGLAGFPAGFAPIGRDDGGDPLAVDEDGRVWSFVHGAGDWASRTPAFASRRELERYVAFQHELDVPLDADLESLRAQKQRVEAFAKTMRTSPFARDALRAALTDLREAIADRRFQASARGRSLHTRQELGQRCEQALREAGASGQWMVRAGTDPRAIVVMGPLAGAFDESRVRALLQPLVGGFELRCFPSA